MIHSNTILDLLSINIELPEELNLEDILKLYNQNYCIFLTSKFFKNNSCIYYLKKNLLTYFDKYDIIYFNFMHKSIINTIINAINNFIKNSSNEEKNRFLDGIPFLDKIKPIYFNDNLFDPDILYKKIQFSNQELFIIFNNYVIKKMEYKLRTFCQIAEKLGAQKIIIDYFTSDNNQKKINISMDVLNASFDGTNNTYNEENESIKIVFEYPNNHSDINLNKFYIINSILNEKEFLITKEEFESDLELKFLIDARCLNFIQKYHTNFIINHFNKIEQKIFLKAQSYGLNIGNMNFNNNSVKFSIVIEFLHIYDNLEIIDGTNIHIMREGFNYLSKIIQKDNQYIKLLRFFESHLNAIQKKWIPYNYDKIDNICKIYHDIINLNYEEYEIINEIELFFMNNLTWTNFKKFRNIILFGNDKYLDKINFITFQYHDIINNKKNLLRIIEKIINNNMENFINNFGKKRTIIIDSLDNLSDSLDESNSGSHVRFNMIEITSVKEDYLDEILILLNKYKNEIKELLYNCYKESFKFNGGMTDNISKIELLNNTIKNILNYYFDNEFKNIEINFENIDLKNRILYDLIDKISTEIIKSHGNNVNEYSPNINDFNTKEKISLLERVQKIFLKFIIKYFDYENSIDLIINKLHIDKRKIEYNMLSTDLLINYLNEYASMNKVYKNYNKYKLFYTWTDFLEIKNFFYNHNI